MDFSTPWGALNNIPAYDFFAFLLNITNAENSMFIG